MKTQVLQLQLQSRIDKPGPNLTCSHFYLSGKPSLPMDYCMLKFKLPPSLGV